MTHLFILGEDKFLPPRSLKIIIIALTKSCTLKLLLSSQLSESKISHQLSCNKAHTFLSILTLSFLYRTPGYHTTHHVSQHFNPPKPTRHYPLSVSLRRPSVSEHCIPSRRQSHQHTCGTIYTYKYIIHIHNVHQRHSICTVCCEELNSRACCGAGTGYEGT